MIVPDESGTTATVAWDRYGSGPGVPLVALHGWSDSGACWAPSILAWVEGRVVLTVDARGHGRTPLPEEPFTIASIASDVARVLRAVLGRPSVVLGHSMGALVAQELALSDPDLVSALLLEDPAWRAGRHVDEQGRPIDLIAGIQQRSVEDAAALREEGRAQNPAWPDDELDPWVSAKLALDPRLAELPHRWDGRDWVESLAGLDLPVTLLTGLPGRGSIVDADQVARAAAILGPLLTPLAFATGHCVRREARPAVESAVSRVLLVADAQALA